MTIFDYQTGELLEQAVFPDNRKAHTPLFLFCRADETPLLRTVWGFDESTVVDCMNIDESVRFSAFDGYNFASLVHVELAEYATLFSEINLYLSKHYFVFVMPAHQSVRLALLESRLLAAAQGYLQSANEDADVLNHLLFLAFSLLLSDFSDILEQYEDWMEALFEKISLGGMPPEDAFQQIQAFRKSTYAMRKILRAFSYMGLQILCNENDFLSKKKMFLFRNLDTRLRKLYDFSENVYGLSTELLHTHDSKLAQRTNDVVNKLTFITLFFGPLTVITGIYGMNFDWMPELDWRFGYPLAIGVMIAVSLVIYLIMKKKKWL